MLRIGLTGGLSSGKTTVAAIFEVLGIPVYYADDASKRIMQDDEEIKRAIIKEFGEQSYSDGKPNRQYLAGIVFSNGEKLTVLNSIMHPATLRDADEWMKKQTSPYIIKEAALIFESGANQLLDAVIGVQAPLKLRLKRAVARDGLTEAGVMSRISRQMDEDKKLSLCDHIIINDEQQLVIPQVLKLHKHFLHLETFQ